MYRSIELLQGTDNVRELAQLSTSYGDLSAYLAENERLTKPLPSARSVSTLSAA